MLNMTGLLGGGLTRPPEPMNFNLLCVELKNTFYFWVVVKSVKYAVIINVAVVMLKDKTVGYIAMIIYFFFMSYGILKGVTFNGDWLVNSFIILGSVSVVTEVGQGNSAHVSPYYHPYISMSPILGVFVTKPTPMIIAGVYINLNRPFFIAHAFNIRAGVNFLPSINTIKRRAVIGIHRVKPMSHNYSTVV